MDVDGIMGEAQIIDHGQRRGVSPSAGHRPGVRRRALGHGKALQSPRWFPCRHLRTVRHVSLRGPPLALRPRTLSPLSNSGLLTQFLASQKVTPPGSNKSKPVIGRTRKEIPFSERSETPPVFSQGFNSSRAIHECYHFATAHRKRGDKSCIYTATPHPFSTLKRSTVKRISELAFMNAGPWHGQHLQPNKRSRVHNYLPRPS